MSELVIVVSPTYNEVDNISALVEGILALPRRYHLLVVDDMSPDGTADRVRKCAGDNHRVDVFTRSHKTGYGHAVAAGLQIAAGRGACIVVQMDADGSHDPSAIPSLVAAIETGADAAIGSRYVPGGGIRCWSLGRRLLSWGANAYVRAILRLPPRDCTSGFRAFTAKALACCDPHTIAATDYAFLVEHLYCLVRSNQTISEVPILFTERRSGRSKLSWKAFTESVVRPWQLHLSL